VVNQDTVRNFLCDWATEHSELVIDDEGEETVRLLAIRAALHDWQTPISDYLSRDCDALTTHYYTLHYSLLGYVSAAVQCGAVVQ
jgi:hypothetical protein